MKIGHLNSPSSGLVWTVSTTHTGGTEPFPYDVMGTHGPRWNWQNTLLSGVEYHITFETEVFASLIRVEAAPGSGLSRIEVAVPCDGGERIVGVYRGESGKAFCGTADITVGTAASDFTVRLFPTLKTLEVPEPAVIGAVFDEPVLYPTPSRVEWTEGKLPVGSLCQAGADSHGDSVFALGFFRQKLADKWGYHGIASDTEVLRFCHDGSLPENGYKLTVTEEQAVIAASDRLGMLYGAERLLELIDGEGVPCCVIEDRPYKAMRGFHFGLPPREEIPFLKKLLTDILIPCHYNMLIMEFAGGMRFDSHPEISEAWLEGNRKALAGEIPEFPHGNMNSGGGLLEKDEVRDFCAFAKDLGFELIPEVQSFGHVQYITYAHPDIAETDESVTERQMDTRSADQPPSTFYYHSYCPQNPKSYEIIFDLIDEIVDLVQPPRFVHMGHDEIYQIGLCPKCKGIPHDVLYEKHVTAMHDYLAKKGLRMMIWGDMLQPTEKHYGTSPAAERLPKDIVLLDFIWYFHFDLDMEDHLLPHGYEVVMGNLYSSHYPRYERRAAKAGMLGGQVSTWCRIDEYTLAREGKLYDLIYTGEMLWSDTYREDCREAYAKVIADRLPGIRDSFHGMTGVKREYTAAALPENGARVPSCLRDVCAGHGMSPRRIGEGLAVPVGEKADGIRFAHTTLWPEKRICWEKLAQVGCYTVVYEDGTEETVPMEYGGNIRCLRERWATSLGEHYYRHQGYITSWYADPVVQEADDNGDSVTVSGTEWINPHPDKVIREIVCRDTGNTGVVVCGVDLVRFSQMM